MFHYFLFYKLIFIFYTKRSLHTYMHIHRDDETASKMKTVGLTGAVGSWLLKEMESIERNLMKILPFFANENEGRKNINLWFPF